MPPITRKGSYSVWGGWIFMPLFPTLTLVPKAIVTDLTRASLAEAMEKGYFDDTRSPAPASSPVALDENGKPIFPE